MTLASEARRARASAYQSGLTLGFAASMWLVAPVAAAQAQTEDAETRTAARDLATQGGQAFDAGRYEQASDFFMRAYQLVHAPSISLMRARSLAKLGQLVEAMDVYEQTARFKLPADAPDAYVKAVETARSEIEGVRVRVPRLKITLQGFDANAEVTIDEKPTPAALLGVERPMNPGVHRVVVLESGQPRAVREVNLAEGKSSSIDLERPRKSAAILTEEPQKLADSGLESRSAGATPERSTMPTSRVIGYAGLGLGVVGLSVGTYTGLVALHHESQLDAACHPSCPVSFSGDLSGFRANRTVSWISYGVGFAAATAGILLLTVGDGKREHAALSVAPTSMQLGGAF